jgi:hypothetical protein
MTYPPKRDLWIVVLISLVAAVEVGVGGIIIAAAVRVRQPLLTLSGCLLVSVGGLIVWIFMSCHYEITADSVLIRFGPLRFALPIDSIVEVHSTSRFKVEFAWGLAWSIDRLVIKCQGRRMPYSISPEGKAAFVGELVRIRPGVKVFQE